MTDYLEELLEEQEAEESGDVAQWYRSGRRVYAGSLYGDAQSREQAAEKVAVEGVVPLPEEAASAAVQHLSGQLDRLRRAVRQAQEQSVRAVAPAQRAVSAGVAERLSIAHGLVGRAADHAAAVDAAFQRDARRYDGPLGLL